jgi:BirA family transcriptional regulator, biotin operon repressor / biotin---[acetyl-CoA-carboxylase] ligase
VKWYIIREMETSVWATPWPGAAVTFKDSTSSTMDDALAMALSGCPTGSVAAAGYQHKGRGRVPGRTWISPPRESLLATVVLRVRELGFPLHELPLRAGVAAALGIEDAAGIAVQIKWPNDVMSPDRGPSSRRKIAGLLCEAHGDAAHGDAALVGIGVNCSQSSFPGEIAETACSLLQCSGSSVPPSVVLSAVLARLMEGAGRGGWQEQMRKRLYDRGRNVRVDLLGSGKIVEGVLRDIDERGRLVLELSDGRLSTLSHGEMLTAP